MNDNTTAKRSLYKRKKIAIIALFVIIAMLIGAFFAVSYFIKIKTVVLDGYEYTLKPNSEGAYVMLDGDGAELEKTLDGHYVLKSGNLVTLNAETGDVARYATVDLTGTEQLNEDGRILIFPYTPRASVQSIEVKNGHGSYSFYKDEKGIFRIKGYVDTAYSSEMLSYLIACSGYTIGKRVDKEISIDKHGFSEYGFDDPSAEYKIITDKGNVYSVEIGDMTVDRNGYYARYMTDGRQALYILPTSYIAQTLLAPLEDFIFPVLTVKPSYNNYIDVQNCTLTHNVYNADGTVSREVYPRFSYLDKVNGESRLDGEYKSQPFFGLSDFAMYIPSSDSVNEMLYNLYSMTFLGTRHLGTDEWALAEYGLDKPAYTLYFENDYTEKSDSTGYSRDVYLHQYVYFSEKTPEGTYYAYSRIYESSTGASGSYERRADYDQIVEIDASMLDFLSFSKANWVHQDYFYLYMQYCDEIKLERDGETVTISVTMTEKDGTLVTVSDEKGNTFTLSGEDVTYVDSNGKQQTAVGSRQLFEDFYTMLAFSTIVGEHGLSETDKTECISDENLDMRMTVTTTSGRIMTYEYYGISDLRSLLLMGVENAVGSSGYTEKGYVESADFFVYAERTEKIWQDAKNLLLGAELFLNGDYEEYGDIVISEY